MFSWPKTIPQEAGVYFFLDSDGKPLYIGKAANLRSRLRSYARGLADPRIRQMIAEASKLHWQILSSDIEALILESQLIKKHYPPFNIMLRDDKQYFYVHFSDDSLPHLSLTHQPLANEKINRYIGPFTSGKALKSTLKLLRSVFPYCTCKQKHTRYCLNYHIGNCPGYCCLKNHTPSKNELAEYKKNIKAIRDILNGKRQSVVKRFEKQMLVRAKQEHFEEAIKLRERLERLKQVFENATVLQNLERTGESNVLQNLATILGLSTVPRRIEGYDIANIQGQYATGAMIVFTNGKAEKSSYRKFRIRHGSMPNDTAMLREVLRRRFNHPEWPTPNLILIDGGKGQLNATISILQEFNLIIPIISLTKNEKHQGDHIYGSMLSEQINLKQLPQDVAHLILQIDAEAHRFAISYYRKLHSKQIPS